MMRRASLLLSMLFAGSLLASTAIRAQIPNPLSVKAGIYGGVVWPVESFDGKNFKETVDQGWMGGGMAQLGAQFGFRADLSYVSFGKSKGVTTLDSKTNVIAGTGALSIDLGGPYILAGGGRYRFEYKPDGSESTTQSYWGANAGFGIPLSTGLLGLFAEGRGHVVFPKKDAVSGNASFVTAAVGIRFR